MTWLKFLHKNQQFRERIEEIFKEFIEEFELDTKFFKNGLDIMGILRRRSEPDWEKMK